MKLLANASGQEEQIGYALNLRYLQDGWTPELRGHTSDGLCFPETTKAARDLPIIWPT